MGSHLLQMTTFHLEVLLDSAHLRRHLEGTPVVTVTTTVITTTTQGLTVVIQGLEARLETNSLLPGPVLDPHEFPSSRELTLLPSPPPLTGTFSSRLGSSPTDPVADSGHLVLVRHSQHWTFSVTQWTTMLLYCLLTLCHVHSAIMYTVHYAAVYHSIVQYCTKLYRILPNCTVLYQSVQYCSRQCSIVPISIVLYLSVRHCTNYIVMS